MWRNLYQTLFRTKLFNQIVMVYSVITITAFVTLAVLIYKYSTASMIQRELNVQSEAADRIVRYLDQRSDKSQDVVLQLYQDKELANNFLHFLRSDLQDYIQHRLDHYLLYNSISEDIDTFFQLQMDNDPDILNIALYSPDQSFLFVYQNAKSQSLNKLTDDNREQVAADIARMRLQKGAYPQPAELNKLLDIVQPGAYTYSYDINDPDTLKYAGTLLITYQPQGIARVLQSSLLQLKGSHLVLFPNGNVVYDSSGRYTKSVYPYLTALRAASDRAKLDTDSFVAVSEPDKSGLLVAAIVPQQEMAGVYRSFKWRVALITSGCIVVTIAFAYMSIDRYSRRTRSIVKAMRLAKNGNLSVRIPVRRSDELDEISSGFNLMCEELTRHIDRVFVSEIKQKQAELVALQAQINPHFLYNTLEAIRMRAITQGAEDVGQMTYTLGSMFRYMIQKETIVTLDEEMDNCRHYLELYRVRFRDKIDYRIDVDDMVRQVKLLKLTVQPLIENFIVHGIRRTGAVNTIAIRAYADKEAGTARIDMKDNGKGIEPAKLQEIQANLEKTDFVYSAPSIGLRNVHDRIRHLYGEGYGLSIGSVPGQGTAVSVTLPLGKGVE